MLITNKIFTLSDFNQSENSLLYKVFISHWKHPTNGDCVEEAKKNLNELGINLSLDELKNKSNSSLKRLVKSETRDFILQHLLSLKEKRSKLAEL